MCGIGGIVTSDREIQPVLDKMMSSLAHRGPDNQTSFTTENLGLAHTRLSIIDLSESSNQPMEDSSGRYVIVYNGEIYNYQNLKKDLIAEGIDFTTEGDTEVLLKGYLKYDHEFLRKIRGFYSFCIFDKSEGTLTLSRDFFGKKPLFFYESNNEFIFGSEIKAITKSIDKLWKVDYKSLSHYLWKGYYANGDTAFDEIKSLKPGETIKVSLDTSIISRHIDSDETNIQVSRKFSKREIGKVEESIKKSVSSRLVSDVPISFLLSGGVDSSLITSIASELADRKIDTHYLGYEDKLDNFKDLAEIVSSKIQSNHFSHFIPKPDFEEAISRIVDVFDEPFADYSSIPSLEIYKSISKKNKVAISGDGADEIFSGYKDSKLFYLYSFLPSFSVNKIKLLNLIYPLLNSKISLVRYLAYGLIIILGSDALLSLSTYSGGWNSHHREKYMTKEGFALTGHNSTEENELQEYSNSGTNSLERYLNYDKKRLSYDFLVKVDRTSMANSLEVRSPYLDKFILKEIFPVHSSSLLSLKMTKKELKQILKLRGLSELSKIKKMGFTPPLEIWILSKESKKFLNKMIEDKDSIVARLFQKEKLNSLISSDKSILRNKSRIWHLMVLHKWYLKNSKNLIL